MFRRILNWLAKNFGSAATPEEAGAIIMLRETEAEAIVDGTMNQLARIKFGDAVKEAIRTKEQLDLLKRHHGIMSAPDRSRLCKGGPIDGHSFANQDGSITDLFTLIRTDSDAPDKQCVVGYHDRMQSREGDVFGTYVAEVEAGVKIWRWTGWDEPVALTSPPPASPPPGGETGGDRG